MTVTVPASVTRAGTSSSRCALSADQLAVPFLGKLAPVVHKEATRASELVRLPRDHPEREFLVRQVGTGKLKALGGIVRVKVDRGRRLIHPARLQLLQAVLAQVIISLAWAVVVGSHGDSSPSICARGRCAGVTLRKPSLCPIPAANSATFKAVVHAARELASTWAARTVSGRW